MCELRGFQPGPIDLSITVDDCNGKPRVLQAGPIDLLSIARVGVNYVGRHCAGS